MHSEPARPCESPPRASAKPRWPDWHGETVACVATGPSLTAEQARFVRDLIGLRVIAVNEAGLTQYEPLAVPTADILYAADRSWWQHYQPQFRGMRVSADEIKGVYTIPLKMVPKDQPMPREPGSVISGDHSGFQALGLALTLGAARVWLFGYDCGGNVRNCHPNRPDKFKRDIDWSRRAAVYNRIPSEWPDVEIVNFSKQSNITAFPKRDLPWSSE